ncbi:cx9C motif-containing protein 4, mitochondrial [Argentina anserina]|uniref:cx9C motif-containing protein 4, mitochondrial n=1 Tax=Argentina anserina TaxID=57926 RepID=UPI0021762813|nr:cx9C motif-containing protein 4, mitochondrial [Potentilla anserina]XP_050376574.1 cx9C motif-containing protein 4, mitochondrial [Potentilla anserina]
MGTQQSKEKVATTTTEIEPCKKESCLIQSCLSKNEFNSRNCLKVIEMLQSCCEKCNYNSTHCASLSGLLNQKP